MKNNTLKYLLNLVITLTALSFLAACSDDDSPSPLPGQEGFFVVNEGAFGNGDASISYFDKATGTLTNDVFQDQVGRPLGDQAQSMTIYNGKGYVVVQNSAKVEVIDVDSYQLEGTITQDLSSPRYFVAINANKGYVSDWGPDGLSGTVKVIDLDQMVVTKTIPTGQGANEMVVVGNKLYVANTGGFGADIHITIINTDTDEVIKKLEVGDNPTSLAVDKDQNVWVAGSGKVVYNSDWSVDEANSIPGYIAKLDNNDEVELKLSVSKISAGPHHLNMNSSRDHLIYSYDGAVYKMSVADTSLPTQSLISQAFYGLAVDPSSDEIVGGAAPNFTSAGKVYRYSLAGVLIGEYTAGIAPRHFAFK